MKPIIPKILVMTAFAGLLAGCVRPDGRTDYTGSGALIGGASGAAIGASADRRNPAAGALIGGVAGLFAGGLVGHSMDEEADARRYDYPVTPPSPPAPLPLGVGDIKSMARSGVSDDIIISQIITTHSIYHLDSNTIIDLSSAGVSQRVITFMINTPTTTEVAQTPPPPQSEIYVAAPGPDYVWVGGEWQWNGGRWVWFGGRWIYPPHGHVVWVEGRWARGPHGWYHERGYWR